ncbi:uncharacterized protein [Palaemon carinicauda]|uniref:uncharacterized protein n=1 Tax=Palaemon carinicauda TaxID=392227 RepID=UPI0035B58DA9
MVVIVGQCNHRNDEVTKLKLKCQSRLALLRKVARGSVGSSVPVLRTLYISVIRSIIDYSASNLITLSRQKRQSLEVLQNEAMRIISECLRTAKIETIRHEIGLPTLAQRIKAVATNQIVKSLNTADDGIFKQAVMNPKGKDKCNKWLNSARELLSTINVSDYLDNNQYVVPELPPWDFPEINVSFSDLTYRKSDVPIEMLRQDFLRRFSALPQSASVLYTDGYLQGNGRAGAGVALYQDGILQESGSLAIRASNHCSTTQTELLGISAALTIAKSELGGVTIVSDSMSALQSIVSESSGSNKLVNRI